MKKLHLFALIMLSFFLVQCTTSDDEVTPDNQNPNSEDYIVNYMNQTLTGKINGVSWTMIGGKVSSSSSHSFNFLDTLGSDTCFAPFSKNSKVIFSLSDGNKLLSAGEHQLKLDWQNTAGNKTVTLVHYNGTTPHNTIIDKGGYEILTIDTIQNIVTGRMDAYYDDDNFVNGNFSIKYCR